MTSAKEDLCAGEKFEPDNIMDAAVAESPPFPADVPSTPLRREVFWLAGGENSFAQLVGAAFGGVGDAIGSLGASAAWMVGFSECLTSSSRLAVRSAISPLVAAAEG